jgi:transposase InsO family protein
VKKRFSEEQIIGFLREADAGVAVKELCRRHGFSEAATTSGAISFGGMDVSDTLIEAWRREYNEERPKRALDGLTPSQYAKQLAQKTVTVMARL